jgi:hypothetical protein
MPKGKPYKSKAQARFMHSQHPEIADRMDKELPNKKKPLSGLPEKKSKKGKSKK